MKNLPADIPLSRPASRHSLRPDLRSRSRCGWVLLLLAMPVCAQTANKRASHSPGASQSVAAAKGAPSTITSFRVIQEQAGQAVEILSTKPVVPSIQAITSPDRVVIDLANARIEAHSKRIAVQHPQPRQARPILTPPPLVTPRLRHRLRHKPSGLPGSGGFDRPCFAAAKQLGTQVKT